LDEAGDERRLRGEVEEVGDGPLGTPIFKILDSVRRSPRFPTRLRT
jgi:hypothetical protein